jgi:hypothetical protein
MWVYMCTTIVYQRATDILIALIFLEFSKLYMIS